MDENTWRLMQVGMWVIGLQTTVILAAIGAAYSSLNKRLERVEANINDIDKRLHVVESILNRKECCMIQDSSQIKKVEQ